MEEAALRCSCREAQSPRYSWVCQHVLPHFRQLCAVDWQPQFVRRGIEGGFRGQLTSKQANCSIVRIVSIVCGLFSASLSRIIASL